MFTMALLDSQRKTTRRLPLAEWLAQEGLVHPRQLASVRSDPQYAGLSFGAALIQSGLISRQDLLDSQARRFDLPAVHLRQHPLSPDLVRKLPEALARRFHAIVLEERKDSLQVGVVNPEDLLGQDELRRALERPLRFAVVDEDDLLAILDSVYRRTDEISSLAAELGNEVGRSYVLETLAEGADVNDAPVVRMLESIFEDAIQVRATDIHIEPDRDVLRLRLRVDGILQEQIVREMHIAPALASRLKMMANLNISERRRPQDGHFSIHARKRGATINVRLSTLPGLHGESVVLRLLDQSVVAPRLDAIGMAPDLVERVERILHRSHGMLLVSGPTGSGKTTTLNAALTLLNRPGSKIVTIEDPVEYTLPRVTQVQVNPAIGVDFAAVLRGTLRQDPDVILVGEMRDAETLAISLRAAMTGHMVLSTIHTNDAISAVTRMLDMGAEPYLIAASVDAVIGQRLVRKVCPYCSEPYEATSREQAWLYTLPDAQVDSLRRGRGCIRCNQTGYQGRIGVFEMLEINDTLAQFIRQGRLDDFYEEASRQTDYQSMADQAMRLAQSGVTTLSEVMRIRSDFRFQSS